MIKMIEKQHIKLYRARDIKPAPSWVKILNKITESKVYIACFNPALTPQAREAYEGKLFRQKYLYDGKIVASERTNLVVETLKALEGQDIKEISLFIDNSFWKPGVSNTEKEPYDANKVGFLFKLYGRSRNIPVEMDLFR